MTILMSFIAAQTLSLSCVVEPPRNVFIKDGTVGSNVLGLPPSMNNWKFDLSLRPGDDGTDVTLNWPGDPIRAGKALAALSIGPHDYSFVSVHAGPCLFTKTSCMFLYTVSEQADGSADILIQPGALNSDGDRSKPFQAFMAGRCSPKVAAK